MMFTGHAFAAASATSTKLWSVYSEEFAAKEKRNVSGKYDIGQLFEKTFFIYIFSRN